MGSPVIAANKVAAQQRRILDTLSAQSAPRALRLPPSTSHNVRMASQIARTQPAFRQGLAGDYERGMNALAKSVDDYGVTEEYLDFLAAHDVTPDVIERIRSGQLDMSPEARIERAAELGFNPERTVYRYDDPGKPAVYGRARNALVYTSFSPEMAMEAAQYPYAKYPLWGASHVAGLDPAPRPVADLLDRLQRLSGSMQYETWDRFLGDPTGVMGSNRGLIASQATGNPLPELLEPRNEHWFDMPAPRFSHLEKGALYRAGEDQRHVPASLFGRWDPKKSMVPDLKEMGYQGVLVADEAPRSVAYFGSGPDGPMPSVRHSVLSALDPEYRYTRNMFMSLPFLLAPTVAEE
jgi:hypothetical protein